MVQSLLKGNRRHRCLVPQRCLLQEGFAGISGLVASIFPTRHPVPEEVGGAVVDGVLRVQIGINVR